MNLFNKISQFITDLFVTNICDNCSNSKNIFGFVKFWLVYMICSFLDLLNKIINLSGIRNFLRFLSGSNKDSDLVDKGLIKNKKQ